MSETDNRCFKISSVIRYSWHFVLSFLIVTLVAFILREVFFKEVSSALSKVIIFLFVGLSFYWCLGLMENPIKVPVSKSRLIGHLVKLTISDTFGFGFIVCICVFPILAFLSIFFLTTQDAGNGVPLNSTFGFALILGVYMRVFSRSPLLAISVRNQKIVIIDFVLFFLSPVLAGSVFFCYFWDLKTLIISLTCSVIFYCFVVFSCNLKSEKQIVQSKSVYNKMTRNLNPHLDEYFDYKVFANVTALYRQGKDKYEEASKCLDEICKKNIDNVSFKIWPYHYIHIGRLYSKVLNVDKALYYTRKAVQENERKCPLALTAYVECLFEETLLRHEVGTSTYTKNVEELRDSIEILRKYAPTYSLTHVDHLEGCFKLLQELAIDHSQHVSWNIQFQAFL